MSFELRVKLTGLCVFVPQVQQRQLHAVLLTHHTMKHYPRLLFDTAYLRGDATTLDGTLRCEPLDDYVLWLRGFGTDIPGQPGAFGNAASSRLPDDIVPITELGCSGITTLPATMLGTKPGPDVAARCTIKVGRMGPLLPGARWKTNDRAHPERDISTGIVWSVPVTARDATSVSLQFEPLVRDGRVVPPKPDIVLHPVEGIIDIAVYNAICDDLPPARPRPGRSGQPADHFDRYFAVHGHPGCAPSCVPTYLSGGGSTAVNTPSDCDCKRPAHPTPLGVQPVRVPFNLFTASTETCIPTQGK